MNLEPHSNSHPERSPIRAKPKGLASYGAQPRHAGKILRPAAPRLSMTELTTFAYTSAQVERIGTR